jgi:hypothetical protein
MKTGKKARAKASAHPGARPESGRDVGKALDRARHSPGPPFLTKKPPASLTRPRLRDTLFGKSGRKDKIIDGQYNSD